MGLGTIIGFINVSLASKKLGLIEYGNFININIVTQVLLTFSILGLSELSVKYYRSNYGLYKYSNFILLAGFQSLATILIVILYGFATQADLLLILPLLLSYLFVRLIGIYLRASEKIGLSNIANSVYFNLIIFLILIFSKTNDHRTLIRSFSLITLILFITLIPSIIKTLKQKVFHKPLFTKSLIFDNFSVGGLVVLNGFFATIDQLIVARYLNIDNLALYKIALIIFLAGSFPHVVINTIAGPKISRLCHHKKYIKLNYLFKKISLIQIFLSISATLFIYLIITSSGEFIFDYASKPVVSAYLLMTIASVATSIRGFSTIILIQTGRILDMLIGQILYIAILSFCFYSIYSEVKDVNAMYYAFTIAHVFFCLWSVIKSKLALKFQST